MARYGTVDQEYALRLAGSDGEVYMLNLMAYREEADYGPGGERGISGREADDRYAPLDVLAEIGARLCFLAEVESGDWDRVAVVRYPTGKSFVDMQSRPDFKAKHVHKDAGMDHTTILGTTPVGGLPKLVSGDLVLLEVWNGGPPPPVVDGDPVEFAVEFAGAIVGDGRTWSGVRYTPIDAVPSLDVDHMAVALRTVVAQWD